MLGGSTPTATLSPKGRVQRAPSADTVTKEPGEPRRQEEPAEASAWLSRSLSAGNKDLQTLRTSLPRLLSLLTSPRPRGGAPRGQAHRGHSVPGSEALSLAEL